MAVPMQADPPYRTGKGEASCDTCEGLFGRRLPGFQQVRRDELVAEQEGAGFLTKCLDIERRSKSERGGSADRMDAADEAADPLERLGVVEVRAAAAAARIERVPEPGMDPRMHGGDDRNLAPGELARKGVLFLDLLVAPPPGPVELQHARRAVLQPHLVDAVLVAVERQQAAVGAQAGTIAGVEHDFGRQRGIRVGHGVIVDAWCRTTLMITCGSRDSPFPTASSRFSVACRSPFPTARWSASSAAAAPENRPC